MIEALTRLALLPWKWVVMRGVANAQRAAAEGEWDGEPILRIVDTEHGPVEFSGHIPVELERDFVTWRSPTYIEPMTNGVARELAAAITGSNTPEEPQPEDLVRLFTRTAVANMVREDPERPGIYVCHFDEPDVRLFVETHVAKFEFSFDADPANLAVVANDGRRITPNDPQWTTALCHVMQQYTIWPPLATHNWVHFNFPCSVAAAWFTTLRGTGTNLEALLAPHVRFTNRINMQAVFVQKSVPDGPGWKQRLTPWHGFPIARPPFQAGVAANTRMHYAKGDHFRLLAQLDDSLPYFRFLSAYYAVVQDFVDACMPHIEDDAWKRFSAEVGKTVHGWSEAEPRIALATFIWQVACYHITEHMSYAGEARRYGYCLTSGDLDTPMTTASVGRWDRYQTCNFLSTFVVFNPNPELDQRITNIDAYGFSEGPLRSAAVTFRDDLQACAKKLAEQGDEIVPLSTLIQSICF